VDGTTEEVVTGGAATDAPFVPRLDRGARLVGAFLFPVAHRTTLRAVVALGTKGIGDAEPGALPDATAVARGWRAQLDRGLRVELPDEQLQGAVDTARAATVLAGQAWRVEPEVVAALEDWGLDAEAALAWGRLSGRARRRLRRRATSASTWTDVLAGASSPDSHLLAALRPVLAREYDASVAFFEEWPEAWIGQSVDVRDAPTRHGPVSCSVRWHGDRAALLWEGPEGVTFTAPGLDPTWSSSEPRGEALLAAVIPRRNGG
jgi:hypothetical protein